LVDKAPVVIDKLKEAKHLLTNFMQSQGLQGKPEDVANLRGNDARAAFVEAFKKVQKLQTQLDQYTDLTLEQAQAIETILPRDELNAFRGIYLETAQRLRALQAKPGDTKSGRVDQLDFEFVLFASATIDYDYIMKLIADFSMKKPGRSTMSREELIGLIAGDSKFIEEREDITEYVRSLNAGEGLDESAVRAGYQRFKEAKAARELADLSAKHGLPVAPLQAFVDTILGRRIFDGEQLTELLSPLALGWKARAQKELALMTDLVPLLKKRAGGRDISGLGVYED
jgi:type I restriction enzyme R subunit